MSTTGSSSPVSPATPVTYDEKPLEAMQVVLTPVDVPKIVAHDKWADAPEVVENVPKFVVSGPPNPVEEERRTAESQRGLSDAEAGGSPPTGRSERTIFGLRRKIFWFLLLVAILLVAVGIGGGIGGAMAVKNSSSGASGSPTATAEAAATASASAVISSPSSSNTTAATNEPPLPSSSLFSSPPSAATSSSAKPSSTSSATSISSRTTSTASPTSTASSTPLDFDFSLWSEPRYGGDQQTIDNTGTYDLSFHMNSYIWKGAGSGCCVRFCKEGTDVGYRCDSDTYRSEASTWANRVVVGCDGVPSGDTCST